jgi:hypothetical protein
LLLFLEVRLPPSSDEKRYSLSSVNIDRQSDGVNALMMSGLKTLFSTALSLLNAPGNLEKKPLRIRHLSLDDASPAANSARRKRHEHDRSATGL